MSPSFFSPSPSPRPFSFLSSLRPSAPLALALFLVISPSLVADIFHTNVQMKQLELQQEREERELVERGSDSATAPVRSRSGNNLATFNAGSIPDGGEVRERRRADYANAKSMPGSRRNSNGLSGEDAVTAGADVRRVMKSRGEGEGPMLNSFVFDDELDADLQSELFFPKPTTPPFFFFFHPLPSFRFPRRFTFLPD